MVYASQSRGIAYLLLDTRFDQVKVKESCMLVRTSMYLHRSVYDCFTRVRRASWNLEASPVCALKLLTLGGRLDL